jgi:hypothetical protein
LTKESQYARSSACVHGTEALNDGAPVATGVGLEVVGAGVGLAEG